MSTGDERVRDGLNPKRSGDLFSMSETATRMRMRDVDHNPFMFKELERFFDVFIRILESVPDLILKMHDRGLIVSTAM